MDRYLNLLFNSYAFLFGFLPWVLTGFWLLGHYESARLWFLLGASLVFYGYWDWHFVPLLVGAIIVNWLTAQAFFALRRGWILVGGIAINLLCLGVFKYLGFFSEVVFEATGWETGLVRLALPLGISFFTFHNIIYLADLRRGKAPHYSFRDYALYIALFPQILAGPLVRHNEIIPQLSLSPLREGWEGRLGRGIVFLLIGLMKKIFLADELAKLADPVFAQASSGAVSVGQAWTAALGFPLQIYFDFSGYSDMAIGAALMLGFALPFNFDVPYRATSLAQFWRRWHMTLMRFLRDYVYIPLGGNRHGAMRQGISVVVTLLLGGLWHGAGWTFIVWGALHGAGLATGVAWRRYLTPLPWPLAWPLLIVFLIVTWIFFRAPTLAVAWTLLGAMAGQAAPGPLTGVTTLAFAAVVAMVGPSSQRVAALLRPAPWLAPIAAVATVLALLKMNGSPSYEFIYFHF